MHVPSRVSSRPLSFGVALAALLMLALFSAPAPAQDITVHGTDDPRAAKKQLNERERPVSERVAAGELPPSKLDTLIKSEAAVVHRLPRISEEVLQKNRNSFEKRTPVGIVRDLPRPVEGASDATCFVTADNAKVGVLKIIAEGAREVRVRFTDFDLPAGARLYVSSAQNPDEVYGPFEGRGMNGDGEFWSPPVAGEAVVVEYVVPDPGEPSAADRLPFRIPQVGHIYVNTRDSSLEKVAGSCNLNIPDEWKTAARSVGRMSFQSGGGFFLCTGTLINSRNNDLTPYFLTANHCISTEEEARSLSVRWFFDSPSASTASSSGATLLSTSTATDYTLLLINGSLPADVRWAGWTTTAAAVGSNVTGIHHPDGDYKRISFGNLIDAACPTGLPGACDNFYKVRWNSGTTEGGSSGSGIWTGSSADPLLVGMLNGGFASCSNLSGTDFYGRFDKTYPQIASFLEGGSDDGFEGNATRDIARAISPGSYNGLIVKSTDEDWYRINVPAGSVIRFTREAKSENGKVRMQLFRGGEASPVRSTTLDSSTESVWAHNSSGGSIDYFLRVYLTDDTRNSYDLRVTLQTCAFSFPFPSTTYYSHSESGSIYLDATAQGCDPVVSSNVSWLNVAPNPIPIISNLGGTTYQVNFSLERNTSTASRTGVITAGGQTFSVIQQGVPCPYVVTPVSRSLSQSGGTGRVDVIFNGAACQNWLATSNANWITVGFVSNATDFSGSFRGTVTYSVGANTSPAARTGTLTVAGQIVNVTQAAADPRWQPTTLRADQVQFKSWRFNSVQPPQAYVKLIFPSTGYRVADWGQLVRVGNDYSVDVVVERFTGTTLPIETATARIYELKDSPQSGNTFTMRFGTGATVMNTITLPSSYPPNPIDNARTYASEHYRDFLGREPDAPGLDFWTNEITRCGVDSQCIDSRRVNVSAAFFLSQEFQATGYYVYRLYRAGLGRVPYYGEFVPDAARVGAGIVVDNRLSPDVINSNKLAFARLFVARAEFRALYDSKTNAEYVDLLAQNTGVALSSQARQSLIDELGATGGTADERRASVLAKVADGIRATPPAGGGVGVDQVFETTYGRAFYDAHFNRAFVLMQYFGYLKRDPDEDGYQFWLAKLNQFGNYRDAEMVRSFVLAAEYRARFGQP